MRAYFILPLILFMINPSYACMFHGDFEYGGIYSETRNPTNMNDFIKEQTAITNGQKETYKGKTSFFKRPTAVNKNQKQNQLPEETKK